MAGKSVRAASKVGHETPEYFIMPVRSPRSLTDLSRLKIQVPYHHAICQLKCHTSV